MKTEITQSDISQWLESNFPSSTRDASLAWEYSQVSRQNGTMANMLAALLGDDKTALDERERYRRIIREWKADLAERRKPVGAK